MRGWHGSKTAKKFDHLNRQKNLKALASDVKILKTHHFIQSEAEILLPESFQPSKFRQLVAMITCGAKTIWADINENSFDCQKNQTQQQQKPISILQNLIMLAGIQTQDSTFRGQIKFVNRQNIPKNYYLDYVQFFVKDVYLSRRDEYKIMKHLEEKVYHVYNKKTMFFDKMKLEVANILGKNNQMVKSGMIDKSTKIIFRTACSKYTLLVEISRQLFQVNHEQQLYLEKAIQFLVLFLLRNQLLSTKHRIEIILFARLFYPQYSTLQEAYKGLKWSKPEQTLPQNEQYSYYQFTNFAVALQKDYQGRIYQDVYRRIPWSQTDAQGFQQAFQERISQFLFIINWKNATPYAKKIVQSMKQSIQAQNLYFSQDELSEKMRPFKHALSCELSNSSESCYFEAISLISQQFKHHYYFRSLTETGNAITTVSAGRSHYMTDETTYKMAKSNVYLANIHCLHINLRWRASSICAEIICLKKKPYYEKQKGDVQKLKGLIDWCKQQDAYLSPTNNLIDFPSHFEMKSLIFPQNLKLLLKKDQLKILPHYCIRDSHYQNQEHGEKPVEYDIKEKRIQFIEVYHLCDEAYRVHQYFYENHKFDSCYRYPPLAKHKKKYQNLKLNKQCGIKQGNTQKQEQLLLNEQKYFSEIAQDFQVIINKKKEYNFQKIGQESLVGKTVDQYVNNLNLQKEKNSKFVPKVQKFQQGDDEIWLETDNIGMSESSEDKNKRKIKGNDQLIQNTLSQLFKIQCSEKNRNLHFNRNSWINEISKTTRISNISKQYRKKALKIIPQRSFKYQDSQKDDEGRLNILEETFKEKVYIASKYEKQVRRRNPKPISHNKQRFKNNYINSYIHYLMNNYSNESQKYVQNFIKQQSQNSSLRYQLQQGRQYQYIKLQKQWKNIVYPILTPIYTHYKTNQNHQYFNVKQSKTGPHAIDEEICRYLMDNFQIQIGYTASKINLSKGHVHTQLHLTSKENVTTFQAIDIDRQKKIIPKMVYRYLSFEQQDCRFGSKWIVLSDSNFYCDQVGKTKKTVKLVILPSINIERKQQFKMKQSEQKQSPKKKKKEEESGSDIYDTEINLQLIQTFINDLKQKYSDIQLQQEDISIGEFGVKSGEYKVLINVGKGKKKNDIYMQEIIEVTIDTNYHPFNVFSIIIEWDYSCATYVNQFITKAISLANRRKLLTHLVSSDHAFNTRWSIATIGEIIFKSSTALQILEQDIIKNYTWIWDNAGYFMERNGLAFIRIFKDKNLIQWRDNTNDQTPWRKQHNRKFFDNFFLISSAYDFVGQIIDNMTMDVRDKRLGSLTLST